VRDAKQKKNGCIALHRLELQLALHRKVLDSQVILPVVGQRLVEGSVLLLGDVLGATKRSVSKTSAQPTAFTLGLRVQMGFCLLSWSHSLVADLTFFFFLGLSFSSSTSSILGASSCNAQCEQGPNLHPPHRPLTLPLSSGFSSSFFSFFSSACEEMRSPG
jgi:hypothetical protein